MHIFLGEKGFWQARKLQVEFINKGLRSFGHKRQGGVPGRAWRVSSAGPWAPPSMHLLSCSLQPKTSQRLQALPWGNVCWAPSTVTTGSLSWRDSLGECDESVQAGPGGRASNYGHTKPAHAHSPSARPFFLAVRFFALLPSLFLFSPLAPMGPQHLPFFNFSILWLLLLTYTQVASHPKSEALRVSSTSVRVSGLPVLENPSGCLEEGQGHSGVRKPRTLPLQVRWGFVPRGRFLTALQWFKHNSSSGHFCDLSVPVSLFG